MSQYSPSLGLPAGSIRAGFENAARSHAAARAAMEGQALPAARQIAVSGGPVEAAIANAAQATSVDFNYLLAQAEVESSMNPDAKAATSSATGLYQFIDSTWLDTVRKHGHRFGLGSVADQIDVTASGSAYVADPGQREAILALRSNPQVASLMAAGLAEDNRAHLMPILGRQPSHGELYLAHFLGAGGAGRFLSELQADPGQSAAALFARPAAANRGIFYAPDGSPRSLAQVMDVIDGKLDRALDRASDGSSAARFARADYGNSNRSNAAGFTPAPYLAADEAVFGPGLTPALTQASLSGPSFRQSQRAPMSQILGSTFGTDPAAAPPQVRRAYDRLKAFGL
ncbi:transglycosylase SLT domain-containing protein [Porphyrobacter sp. ULC335]|uniref:transglycosylase SLT domain-containing protein n=1 Tax=Porphyrobacter sp. ULC335 TaxID=2854260 RepID=UPI002220E45C|nr:transglycosylase SLT domain-containing protein [Porphyrobacter sp. ULC335]UYV16719.1 transglycosylase SLT domain-containing protein [Porphyrobacter sp. ULC335]